MDNEFAPPECACDNPKCSAVYTPFSRTRVQATQMRCQYWLRLTGNLLSAVLVTQKLNNLSLDVVNVVIRRLLPFRQAKSLRSSSEMDSWPLSVARSCFLRLCSLVESLRLVAEALAKKRELWIFCDGLKCGHSYSVESGLLRRYRTHLNEQWLRWIFIRGVS